MAGVNARNYLFPSTIGNLVNLVSLTMPDMSGPVPDLSKLAKLSSCGLGKYTQICINFLDRDEFVNAQPAVCRGQMSRFPVCPGATSYYKQTPSDDCAKVAALYFRGLPVSNASPTRAVPDVSVFPFLRELDLQGCGYTSVQDTFKASMTGLTIVNLAQNSLERSPFPTSLANLPNLQQMRISGTQNPAPNFKNSQLITQCSFGSPSFCIPFVDKENFLNDQPFACVGGLQNVPVCPSAMIYKETPGVIPQNSPDCEFVETAFFGGAATAPWRSRGSCCGFEGSPGFWLFGKNLQYIKCDKDLRITELSFSSMSLSGAIPNITQLEKLEKFDIGSNRFSSTVDVFGGNLTTSLKFLALGNPRMQSAAPQSISKMINLEILWLDTPYPGPLPDMRNLTSLHRCTLMNSVTCIPFVNAADFRAAQPPACQGASLNALPTCVGATDVYLLKPIVPEDCSRVAQLFFPDNNPPWFPNANCCGWNSRRPDGVFRGESLQFVRCDGEAYVTHISFWRMGLSGTVQNLSSLTRLRHLELSDNSFSDIKDLEAVSGTIKYLSIRDLRGRRLPFPESISQLINLETLLVHPTFTGTIPNLVNLTSLSTCAIFNPTCIPASDRAAYISTQPRACREHLVNMPICREYESDCNKLSGMFYPAGLEPWAGRPTCCGWQHDPGWFWGAENWRRIECDADGRITVLKLFAMYITPNYLSGTIPDLSVFSRLEQVNLGENYFYNAGDFYAGLAPTLKVLHVFNRFGGPIPDLSALTQLEECVVNQNSELCIPFVNKQVFWEAQPPACQPNVDSLPVCPDASATYVPPQRTTTQVTESQTTITTTSTAIEVTATSTATTTSPPASITDPPRDPRFPSMVPDISAELQEASEITFTLLPETLPVTLSNIGRTRTIIQQNSGQPSSTSTTNPSPNGEGGDGGKTAESNEVSREASVPLLVVVVVLGLVAVLGSVGAFFVGRYLGRLAVLEVKKPLMTDMQVSTDREV
ncbi:hypothetical protein HDU67_005257 [Dinochytrium kinnereticum]|nr:hypothetical protein HDU67_005257 [Dinochytrium kinnereticum]